MALLYSNENFPLPAVLELRRLGHNVLTVAESGHANIQMTDAEVLAFATNLGRAVVTFNRRHFIALHQQNPNHAGIIVCTVHSDFHKLAHHIHEAIQSKQQTITGNLLRITQG